jgi:sporulation protein YlmC with PRC-barrel domain
MADYKFDGKELHCRGSKVGVLDGKYIKDSNGKKVGEIDGKYIKDSHGKKLAEFDGKVIEIAGKRIATIDDIKKQIDGVGGVSLVALWVLLVR